MIDLDLQISNPSRYSFDRKRLFDVVVRAISSQRDRGTEGQKYSVSVLVVNKRKMAEFNLKYHETLGPTDVLSFPYTDPQSAVSDEQFVTPPGTGVILGDLIVCYPVAREEAAKQGKSVQDLLDFYVDHGLHHLLGIHHE